MQPQVPSAGGCRCGWQVGRQAGGGDSGALTAAPPPPPAVREPCLGSLMGVWQDMNVVSGAGDIKDDSALLLRQEVSRASQIGFRNPRPQINSDAQEFIKEARQSACEKTHFPPPAKPGGPGGILEGREQSGNRTRVQVRTWRPQHPWAPLRARPGSQGHPRAPPPPGHLPTEQGFLSYVCFMIFKKFFRRLHGHRANKPPLKAGISSKTQH